MSFADYVARAFGKTAVWVYRIETPGETFHLTGWIYDGQEFGWTASANRPDDSYPAGVVFDFAGVNRGVITETTAAARAEFWLSLPTSHPAMIAADAADDLDLAVTVTVWVTYLGDPDEEYVTRFAGRVTGIELGKVLSRLICADQLTEMDRATAAQVASLDCRHVHYRTEPDGSGCGLDLEDWQQAAEVTDMTGRTVTVPLAALQPDGTFTLGFFSWSGTHYLITNHVGDQLDLKRVVPGLATALGGGPVDVLIAPGCDLKIITCKDRFDNVLNHGGLPGMVRGETPFDGRSIA